MTRGVVQRSGISLGEALYVLDTKLRRRLLVGILCRSGLSRVFGKCGQITKIWNKHSFGDLEYQVMLTHMPNVKQVTMDQSYGAIPQDFFYCNTSRWIAAWMGEEGGRRTVALHQVEEGRNKRIDESLEHARESHIKVIATVVDILIEVLHSCSSLDTFGDNETAISKLQQ